MSQELIERIEKFRERGCDTETHVLLCDCRDELTKQAEEIERLTAVIRRVIRGNWSVTDLQEAINEDQS